MTRYSKKLKKPTKLLPEVQEPERNYWLPILITLTIIGAALRFYHLDFNSLWLDEISTYKYSVGTFANMWQMWTTGTDYAPPLYFFLQHFVLEVLGTSEWTMRLLPAFFGVVTIPVAYLVGKEFWDKDVGLITAGLFTFSPFLLYYSQEARAYALALLLVSAELYFFLKATKSESIKDWALFGVLAGLAFWTHYYTLVFTGLLFIYMLVTGIPALKKDINSLKPLLTAAGVMLLVTLPIIITVIPLLLQITASAPTYGVQGVAMVYATFNHMSGFSDYTPLLFLILFIIGIFVTWRQDHTNQSLLLVWIIAGTLLISMYMSYKMPMNPRYVIFLTIPFFLGIAMAYVGIRNLIPKKVESHMIIIGVLILLAVAAGPYYLNYYQNYSKEDWKGIAKDLESITVPGDTVVSVPLYIGFPLDYYYSSTTDQTIEKGVMGVEELDPIRQTNNQSVYYIMTPDIYAADPAGKSVDWLRQNTNLIRNYGSVWLLKRR